MGVWTLGRGAVTYSWRGFSRGPSEVVEDMVGVVNVMFAHYETRGKRQQLGDVAV